TAILDAGPMSRMRPFSITMGHVVLWRCAAAVNDCGTGENGDLGANGEREQHRRGQCHKRVWQSHVTSSVKLSRPQRRYQFFRRPKAFSTKLKSNTWLGGISLVTARLFLVKSMAPRIHASSK